MPSTTDDRLTPDDVYDGPVIVARTRAADEQWIWVANGTRLIAEVFETPGLVGALRHQKVASPRAEDVAAAEYMDALRPEAWEGEADEPWTEGHDSKRLDDAEGVGEGATATALKKPEVEVLVLGPVEVVGWRLAPNRAVVTELVCYLALHRNRAIPGDELRAALWPDVAREASAKSLRTYMSLLRKSLGPEYVPMGSGSGYRIDDAVSTDWLRFGQLTGTTATPNQLRAALELVRGRPFSGVLSTSFGWVFSELLVSEIEVGVVDAARRLAGTLSRKGDLAGASWAVRQGLLAVPNDYGLWELRMSIAGRQNRDELARARRDAEAALGEDVVDLIDQAVGREGD